MGPQRRGVTYLFGGILLLFAFRNYTTSRKTIQDDLLRKSFGDYGVPKQHPVDDSSLRTKPPVVDRVLEKTEASSETGEVAEKATAAAVGQKQVDPTEPTSSARKKQNVETPLMIISSKGGASPRSSVDASSDAGEIAANAPLWTTDEPSAAHDIVTAADDDQEINTSNKPHMDNNNNATVDFEAVGPNHTKPMNGPNLLKTNAGSVPVNAAEASAKVPLDQKFSATSESDNTTRIKTTTDLVADASSEVGSNNTTNSAHSGPSTVDVLSDPLPRMDVIQSSATTTIENTAPTTSIEKAAVLPINATVTDRNNATKRTTDDKFQPTPTKNGKKEAKKNEKVDLQPINPPGRDGSNKTEEQFDDKLKPKPGKKSKKEPEKIDKADLSPINPAAIAANTAKTTADDNLKPSSNKNEKKEPKKIEKADLLPNNSTVTDSTNTAKKSADDNRKPSPSKNKKNEPNKIETANLLPNNSTATDSKNTAKKSTNDNRKPSSNKSEKKEAKKIENANHKPNNSTVSDSKNTAKKSVDANLRPSPSKSEKKEPKKNDKPNKKQWSKEPGPIPNVLIAYVSAVLKISIFFLTISFNSGVQKGGTTSIAHYLKETQDACFSDPKAVISRGEGKESHFFDNFKTYNSSGLEYYQRVFEHCVGKTLIIDGTPEFMKTGQRIFDTYTKHGSLDKLKIIISLREPVSREISWYNHRLRDCPEQVYARSVCNAETNELVPFLRVVQNELAWKLGSNETRNVYGTYVQYLKVFFELFDRKNILIISYEEAKSDQKALLQRIHKFLDLPGKPKQLPHENSDDGKQETPPCAVQRALARRFEPYNEALYKLLEENPGPSMEQRPFLKFHNKCFEEDFPADEPDPFQKTLAEPSKSKHIIPNILIAGAHQTLTTAVSNYCTEMMKGCQPAAVVTDDESSTATHFFDNSNNFKKGLAFYQSLFEHCGSNDTAVIDASADLILYPRRVREQYELQGQAETVKIIFILRDPVHREIEAFQNRALKCQDNNTAAVVVSDVCAKDGQPVAIQSFMEQKVLTKLQNKNFHYMVGVYAIYLKTWFEVWDRQQILLLRYEELENRPKLFLGRIHDFLGIQPPAKANNLGLVGRPKTNESSSSCTMREKLSTHFAEHNEALYALLAANPGPTMEQKPFPKFESHKCTS
jgi:Sulfotransferase domain